MILDSSAIIALARREHGHERLRSAVESAPVLGVGAPSLVETGMVLDGNLGVSGADVVRRLVVGMGLEAVPFGPSHWVTAHSAFLRFGKGRHPAALNFGDCLSYAVARIADRPLLCVGDDFVRTDLEVVRP